MLYLFAVASAFYLRTTTKNTVFVRGWTKNICDIFQYVVFTGRVMVYFVVPLQNSTKCLFKTIPFKIWSALYTTLPLIRILIINISDAELFSRTFVSQRKKWLRMYISDGASHFLLSAPKEGPHVFLNTFFLLCQNCSRKTKKTTLVLLGNSIQYIPKRTTIFKIYLVLEISNMQVVRK